MRRALGVVLTVGVMAAWACTSSYSSDDPTDAGSDAPATQTTPDGSVPPGITNEAGPVEANIVDPPPTNCGSSCDCDGDGYTVKDAGCEDAGTKYTNPPPDSGASPQPLYDCDDHDSQTHPRADFETRVPVPPQNGDWDCSGFVEKRYDAPVNCSVLVNFCLGGTGFSGPVACGETGTLVTCTGQGSGQSFTCKPVPTGTQDVQGCR